MTSPSRTAYASGNANAIRVRSMRRSPTATARACLLSILCHPPGDAPLYTSPALREENKGPSTRPGGALTLPVGRCYSVADLPPPRPPPDTWVVVVNWNGALLLGACLDALARQSHPVHVVVVDNGSTDESEKVVTGRAGVEWCPAGENLGFAGGSNVGIRRALEARRPLRRAREHGRGGRSRTGSSGSCADADAHPEAGIFGGLLLFADDPGRVNSTGLVMDALGRVRDWDFGVEVARLAREDGPTLGVTGGAVLLRADALRRVGLLDPAYFAYYEDADPLRPRPARRHRLPVRVGGAGDARVRAVDRGRVAAAAVPARAESPPARRDAPAAVEGGADGARAVSACAWA